MNSTNHYTTWQMPISDMIDRKKYHTLNGLPSRRKRPDLVERLLRKIPAPTTVLVEDKFGDLTSVKNPTLEAVLSFVAGDFKVEYDGKEVSYADLPDSVQRNILGFKLQTFVVLKTCPDDLKAEVLAMFGRKI